MSRDHIKLLCRIYLGLTLEISYWFLCVLQTDCKLEVGGNLVVKNGLTPSLKKKDKLGIHDEKAATARALPTISAVIS